MKKILCFVLFSLLLASCSLRSKFTTEQENNSLENIEINVSNTWALEIQTGWIDTEQTGWIDIEQTGWIDTEQTWSIINEQSGALIEEVVPSVEWLENSLEVFNYIFKYVLLNSWQWEKVAIPLSKVAVLKWGKIIKKYSWYNVKWFEKTIYLSDKIDAIGVKLLTASNYISEWKMDLWHTELEEVRMEISIIRQENSIKSISDDMLVVHNKMEELIEWWEIKDLKKIEDLKSSIQILKEYNTDNEDYSKMLWDFENVINSLNDLLWQDYIERISELKPLFIKMYMKFG